ncbi:MAG: hypothetical protein AB7Q16_05925 [Vicinamibacterales bacterium]
MIRGLQAVFHGQPLGLDLLAELRAMGVEAIRADCQKLDDGHTLVTPERTAEVVREVTAAGLFCLATVYDPSQVALLQPGDHVEFRGEPDIGHPGTYADTQPIPPDEYRRLLLEFHAAATARGLHVWAGVISNLNTRGLEWLANARPDLWPADVGVAIHWYPHGDGPHVPHPGFRSRDHEVDVFQRVIGARPWIVSEFGYHTARRRVTRRIWGFDIPVGYTRWTDGEVARHVSVEWAFWERRGAVGAALFQLNDGPLDTMEHRFGIRRVDGGWKPVADTFRRTT